MLIITAIVTGVASAVTRFVLNKSLGPYMPETKKLNSYIKKFLLFIFLYALPIASIIFLMVVPLAVDKSFVFCMVINFFALAVNISVHLHYITLQSLLKSAVVMNRPQASLYSLVSPLHEFLKLQNERIKTIEQALIKKA